MNLHGELINLSDQPTCVLHGSGVVTRLSNLIEVTFPSGVKQNYDAEGVNTLHKKQMLFWHSPIYTIPPKSATRNTRLQRAINKLLEILGL